MVNYNKWEIEEANELNKQIENFTVTPQVIRAYSTLWDTIDRFACWSIKDVQSAVCSSGVVPQKLKDWIIKIIKAKGNTNTFFSPHFKYNSDNFNIFVKSCIENRVNPAGYLFDGALSKNEVKVSEYTFSYESN